MIEQNYSVEELRKVLGELGEMGLKEIDNSGLIKVLRYLDEQVGGKNERIKV